MEVRGTRGCISFQAAQVAVVEERAGLYPLRSKWKSVMERKPELIRSLPLQPFHRPRRLAMQISLSSSIADCREELEVVKTVCGALMPLGQSLL